MLEVREAMKIVDPTPVRTTFFQDFQKKNVFWKIYLFIIIFFLTGSPPQQVVRQPQLLVTDGSGVPGSGPNQLQLPQRPTPPGGLPNLPKPVPSQAAAHTPKIIPGKGM